MRLSKFNIFVGDNSLKISSKIKSSVSSSDDVFYRSDLFSVDEVRTFIKRSYELVRPTVFVLENAEKMTVQAQNALLKLAEEPPERCCIVLITNDVQKLLPTIRSRASIFSGFSEKTEDIFDESIMKLAEKLHDNLHVVSKVNVLNLLDHIEKEQHERFFDYLLDCWSRVPGNYRELSTISYYATSVRPSTNITRHLSDLLLRLWDIRNGGNVCEV